MKVLAMTSCVMDIFPQTNKRFIGGNSVNFAIQCRRSGLETVAVLGAVGGDEAGTIITGRLQREKVDTSHLHVLDDGFTATHAIMISETGERLFFPENWQPGVFETFRPADEDWNFIETFDILAGVGNDPNFPALVERKKPHQSLVVDFLTIPDSSFIRDYLGKVDIAFASGTTRLAEELRPLSAGTDTLIVITLGPGGSIALIKGEKFFQEALAVPRVVDTTGCGDAYQAAFTVAWYKYEEVRKAMLDGTIAAGKILAHPGAVG